MLNYFQVIEVDLIQEIREKQNQIVVMINTAFDELVYKVETLQLEDSIGREYEVKYPITNTTGFKGRKPIAILLNGERIICPTWKVVVETILGEILKDSIMEERIRGLADKLLGRVRNRLSTSPDKMRSPKKIKENLYIETHYDTETLMNFLLQILKEIKYDFSAIYVFVKS